MGLLLHAWVRCLRNQEATGERNAIIWASEERVLKRFSFSLLEELAENLSKQLRSLGCGKGSKVALSLQTSPAEVVALLSILKIDAIYAPLDPSSKATERQEQLKTVHASILLTHERGCRWDGGVCLVLDLEGVVLEAIPSTNELMQEDPVLHDDGESCAHDGESCADRGKDLVDQGCFYILFTSGSTGGQRKGVLGTQRGAWNRFEWMYRIFPFQPTDLVLRRTPLVFVDSVWEVLGTILGGACLLIPAASLSGDPVRYWQTVKQHRITYLSLTPSLLSELLQLNIISDSLNSVRLCISSGEPLRFRTAELFFEAIPTAKLLNLYGSTEVSGDTTYFLVECPGELKILQASDIHKFVPIGSPIDNTSIAILSLDEEMQGVEDGEPGELCALGEGLALGYYNAPEETEKRFLPSITNMSNIYPSIHSSGKGETMYRSGDIVVRDPASKLLSYVGRVDNQKKIRGIRIELEEVEAKIMEVLGVEGGVGVITTSASITEGESLLAFLDKKAQDRFQTLGWAHVRRELPSHLMPAKFHFLEELPRTITEKLDRKKLMQSIPSTATDQDWGVELNSSSAKSMKSGQQFTSFEDLRAFVASLYARELGSECHPTESFFEEGGDSLKAVKILWQIQERFHVVLSLQDLDQSFDLVIARVYQGIVEQTEPAVKEVSELNVAKSLVSEELKGSKPTKKRARAEAFGKNGSSRRGIAMSKLGIRGFGRVENTKPYRGTTQNEAEVLGKGLHLLWQVDLLKCIDATPLVVVWEGTSDQDSKSESITVFIGSHAQIFVAVDGRSGEELWRTKLGGRVEGSAVLDDQGALVFVGCYDYKLYALRVEDGELAFTVETGGEIKCAPLVLGNIVYFGSYDHHLYAVDAKTGEVLGVHDCGGNIYASPVFLPSTQRLCVCTTQGRVIFLRSASLIPKAKAGESYFRECPKDGLSGLGFPIFSTPLVCEKTSKSSNGTNIPDEHRVSFLVVGFADGTLQAIAEVGGEVIWKITTNAPIFSSPRLVTAADEWVAFGSHDRLLRLVDKRDGALVWSQELDGEIFASPWVSQELNVVATTTGNLYIFHIETGRCLCKFKTPGHLFSSPVLWGSKLWVGCRDNNLYCFDLV